MVHRHSSCYTDTQYRSSGFSNENDRLVKQVKHLSNLSVHNNTNQDGIGEGFLKLLCLEAGKTSKH